MMGWRSFAGGCAATLISLAIPLAFLLLTEEKSYLVAWPIFGTSNQMLASLTLLALSAWLAKSGKKVFYVVIPMIFMMAMTLVALVLQIKPFIAALPDILKCVEVKGDVIISGVCGIILLILSGSLIFISAGIMLRRTAPQRP
jgi:carbon starvation protein